MRKSPPADAGVVQRPGRDHGGQEHAGLPAERDERGGPRAQARRPGLGRQRHPDAELRAQADPGDEAEEDEQLDVGRQSGERGEDREDEDGPREHADAPVVVRGDATDEAADDRADERDRGERSGRPRAQREGRADRGEREAEDEQVEAVHRVADDRGGEGLPGLGVDAVGTGGCRPVGGHGCVLLGAVRCGSRRTGRRCCRRVWRPVHLDQPRESGRGRRMEGHRASGCRVRSPAPEASLRCGVARGVATRRGIVGQLHRYLRTGVASDTRQ